MQLPLLAIAAAGSVLSGIGTIMSGRMQGKAAANQKLGAEIEAKMAMLRGTQIGERSREDLATTLQNIDAIRSTRGASLDSATGQMIERRTRQSAYRDEAVARLGELNRAQNATMAARGYGMQARWALPLSVLQSAGQFAQAASYGQMARR